MPLPKTPSAEDRKIDDAMKDTFPASDAPSSGSTTATEAPARPVDRKASVVRKEDIEAAQRGDGHKQ